MNQEKKNRISQLLKDFAIHNEKSGMLFEMLKDSNDKLIDAIRAIIEESKTMSKQEANKYLFEPLNLTTQWLETYASALKDFSSNGKKEK